ncbi:MAG: hypothetical protein CMP33_03880 [Rickettsiales bacterium]|nr:hypothetical protein [Rickettsiales bacterium]|tara:strand:+ start:928 stop:1113 length:186 start_codon:yes stop_codon:yes gene_type:complete
MSKNFDESILNFLKCPETGKELFFDRKNNTLFTQDREKVYKIEEGIPILLVNDENSNTQKN